MNALKFVLTCDAEKELNTQRLLAKKQKLIADALFYKSELEDDFRLYEEYRDGVWLEWADRHSFRYLGKLKELEAMQ